MKEHTITTMRQLLASNDSDVIAGLKADQRHQFRALIENQLPKFFSHSVSAKQQAIKAAARSAGITNQRAIQALSNELISNPQAILKGSFWGKIGRGLASTLTPSSTGGVSFDTSYKIPERGGVLSNEASSLERIGGAVGTGIYKAGRALKKAEKWLTPWDPDYGNPTLGMDARRPSRGSLFDPNSRTAADRDHCLAQKVQIPGSPGMHIGYKLGSSEYERCMQGQEADELGELKRVLSHRDTAAKIPDFVRALGIDPEIYLKKKASDIEHRGRSWGRAVQGFRGR